MPFVCKKQMDGRMKNKNIMSFGLFDPDGISVRKCRAERIIIKIFLKGVKYVQSNE